MAKATAKTAQAQNNAKKGAKKMEIEVEEVETLKVDSKGRVTIPAEVRNDLRIEKGSSKVEIAFLGTQEDSGDIERFAKEIYELLNPLVDEMYQEEDMPSESEQIALKRVEERLEKEFS